MPVDNKSARPILNKPSHSNYIVFTDLDGTLLDHDNYSYHAADEALALLRERQIPLILASSKTAAEISPLRAALGFDHCEAIVENGAGVLEPAGHADQPKTQMVTDYDKIIDILSNLPRNIGQHFVGFSNWSADEVSQQTGLDIAAARAAKTRQFSEPGIWQGNASEWENFRQLLSQKNIHAQQGGRYISLSFGGNKADQMQKIISQHQTGPTKLISIALGDANNDIPMLEAADHGIVIPNPSHNGISRLNSECYDRITRAAFSGPRGWNQSLMSLINDVL